MTFYERYSEACRDKNMLPSSQSTADLFGVTKSAICNWGIKSTAPKGETIARIATELNVSADYLLGLTDDKTPSDSVSNVNAELDETVYSVPFARLLAYYKKLNPTDAAKLEGFAAGLAASDTYSDGSAV